MQRVQVAIEVGPVRADARARLEAAGHRVLESPSGWRVVVEAPVLGQHSIRGQAHVLARRVVADFGLEALSDPPVVAIRDPDGVLDIAVTAVMLEGVRRAYDPDPLRRHRDQWWRSPSELGLIERRT